jgi:hypothetical protein
VKYEKITLFLSVFSVVGAHNLHVQTRKRNKIKTLKHTHSSLISMAKCCTFCRLLGHYFQLSANIFKNKAHLKKYNLFRRASNPGAMKNDTMAFCRMTAK